MDISTLFTEINICPEDHYILYVQRKVIVLLTDQTHKVAKLLDIADRLLVLENDDGDTEVVPYDQVQNLFYCGTITDYLRKRGTGTINAVVRFKKSEPGVEENLLPYIYYDEYNVTVACHLEKDGNGQQLLAHDIHVVEKESLRNTKCLKGVRVRIEKNDGTFLHTRVSEVDEEKVVILNASYKKEEIPFSEIASINKTTDVGDHICIRLKDGTSAMGTVSAVSEASGHITLEDGTEYPFYDIADIDFVGSHISAEEADGYRMLDDKYYFKDSFISDASFHYLADQCREIITKKEDLTIYYKIGLSAKGLIAKQVHLRDSEDAAEKFGDTKLGVVLFFDPDKRFGYIGDHYVEGGLQNIGRAQFQENRFKTPFQVNLEYVYIVKYKVYRIGEKYDLVDSLFGLELVERYLKGIYKEIHIENDEVVTVPFEESERMNGYITGIQANQGKIVGDNGLDYVFQTESLLNNQTLHLAQYKYRVSFVPFANTAFCRARAVRIEEEISRARERVNETDQARASAGTLNAAKTATAAIANAENKTKLKESDKRKIYHALMAQFAPEVPQQLTSLGQIMVTLGYPSSKYGKASELIATELKDFISLKRISKTEMAFILHENTRYGELTEEEKNAVKSQTTPFTPQVEVGAEGDSELDLKEDSPYEYGMLIFKFGSTLGVIRSRFIRNADVDPDDISDMVQFDPKQITCESTITTANNVYLVKFVRGGTVFNPKYNKEVPEVDYSYPLLVEQTFKRKQYNLVQIQGNQLHWEKVGIKTQEVAKKIPEKYEKLAVGETYFVQKSDESILACTSEEEKTPKEIMEAGKEISKVYRIGYITYINFDNQDGVINGIFPFHTDVMDPKTLNVLKALKGCEHGTEEVIFSYTDGAVDFISKLTQEFLGTLDWKLSTVTDTNSDKKELYFDHSEMVHHLAVSSDSWVYKLFTAKKITENEVYIREANCLKAEGRDEATLQPLVLDVHCTEETATIQYDELKDQYFAYRNQTYFRPIKGDKTALSELAEQKTEISVFFRPTESDKELTVVLDQAADVAAEEDLDETEETIISDIASYELTKYYLRKSKEEAIMFPKDMLDENGNILPEKTEEAVKTVARSRESLRKFRAASLMMESNIDKVRINIAGRYRNKTANGLIVDAYDRKVMDIIGSPNGVYEEYSYLISIILNSGIGRAAKYRYYLLAQDFLTRDQLKKTSLNVWNEKLENIDDLLEQPLQNVGSFLGHVLLLDDSSFENICESIAASAKLAPEINAYLNKNYEEIHENDVISNLKWLRSQVGRTRRRLEDLLSESRDIREKLKLMLQITNLYLKPILSEEEMRSFTTVSDCLTACELAGNESDLNRRIERLQTAKRDISDLENKSWEHPTKYIFELLLGNGNALEEFANEIVEEINNLYLTSRPNLICVPNHDTISRTDMELELILDNSMADVNQSISVQEPKNVTIELESASMGASIVQNPAIDVAPGGRFLTNAGLDLSSFSEEEDTITINYTIRFDYYIGYNQLVSGESSGDFTLAVNDEEGTYVDKDEFDEFDNPYSEPATANTKLDEKMFFGRTKEIEEIWNYLVRGESFYPGRAIILYGQKKTGKTALVEKILGMIHKNAELFDQAIVISIRDMGAVAYSEGLSNFHHLFYKEILSQFDRNVHDYHPDVAELLDSGKLELPDLKDFDTVDFNTFFERFQSIDCGRHTILLVMDEFTRLTTRIRADLAYHDIPSFMKSFAYMGFIQIVIGHDSMMRAFEELGVINTCAEFTKRINLTAFKEEDARQLITEPMESLMGVNVYDSPLGELAIRELMDLSGNSPYYLMKLCDVVCGDYLTNEKSFISYYDVKHVISEYIDEEVNDTTYFDILLTEDGDSNGGSYVQLDTFKYLRVAAEKARFVAERTCALADVKPEGMDEETIEETRELLASRQVIEVRGGRVKIFVGLFAQYVFRRFGE